MKTARAATEASAYMAAPQRGLPLRIQQDQYTHSTTVCTPLNTDHDSHSSGGFSGRSGSSHGSFSSNSGFSGGGRKF